MPLVIREIDRNPEPAVPLATIGTASQRSAASIPQSPPKLGGDGATQRACQIRAGRRPPIHKSVTSIIRYVIIRRK
jgi:hypothetical protein